MWSLEVPALHGTQSMTLRKKPGTQRHSLRSTRPVAVVFVRAGHRSQVTLPSAGLKASSAHGPHAADPFV